MLNLSWRRCVYEEEARKFLFQGKDNYIVPLCRKCSRNPQTFATQTPDINPAKKLLDWGKQPQVLQRMRTTLEVAEIALLEMHCKIQSTGFNHFKSFLLHHSIQWP